MKDETGTALVVKAHRGRQPTHTVGALKDLQRQPLPLLNSCTLSIHKTLTPS